MAGNEDDGHVRALAGDALLQVEAVSAVMKMTGMACPRDRNACQSATPDMRGMAISRMRQSEFCTDSERRKASADPNASTAKPNSRTKSGRASRTDSSSSTMETSTF